MNNYMKYKDGEQELNGIVLHAYLMESQRWSTSSVALQILQPEALLATLAWEGHSWLSVGSPQATYQMYLIYI